MSSLYSVLIIGNCYSPTAGECKFFEIIKDKIEKKFYVNMNIKLLSYNNIGDFDKVKISAEQLHPDAIVFQVLSLPFMMRVGIFNKGKSNYFNFPWKKESKLIFNFPFDNEGKISLKNSIGNFFWDQLNYIGGGLIGNASPALREFKALILNIYRYCYLRNISLIIQGPLLIQDTYLENYFVQLLDDYLKKEFSDFPVKYVSGLEEMKPVKDFFIERTGYLNDSGNDKLAQLLLPVISQKIINKNTLDHLKGN